MTTHYPPVHAPRVCKVTLVFKRDTRQFLNTFHATQASNWNLTDMGTLATIVQNWFNASYKQVIPNDVSLTQIQLRKQEHDDPLALDVALSPAIAGTRGTPTEAGNVSITMSERTGKAGRAFRGRMYVPGVIEGDVTVDDRISSALVTGLSGAISALISTLLTNAFPLGIFHRPGLVPNIRDNGFDPVIGYVIENIIDSQRRRLPTRGR